MPLSPMTEQFVAHFGEMGSRWGINRTVGQIYALIFVSPNPLHADEIAQKLSFSRSNVSMGLKELTAWRLVRLLHIKGDRREYFEAPGDAWEIFKKLADERRKREVEPTLSMLRDALLMQPSSDKDVYAQERMRDMYQLMETANTWFDEIQSLSPEALMQLMKMGTQVRKLLTLKNNLFSKSIQKEVSEDESKDTAVLTPFNSNASS